MEFDQVFGEASVSSQLQHELMRREIERVQDIEAIRMVALSLLELLHRRERAWAAIASESMKAARNEWADLIDSGKRD
ncbi:MAG: hypothetical protein AAF889_05045 [Cyanobacteria bacterium P01_D01_bin.73]